MVDYLKSVGKPDNLKSVLEEPEVRAGGENGAGEGDGESDPL